MIEDNKQCDKNNFKDKPLGCERNLIRSSAYKQVKIKIMRNVKNINK